MNFFPIKNLIYQSDFELPNRIYIGEEDSKTVLNCNVAAWRHKLKKSFTIKSLAPHYFEKILVKFSGPVPNNKDVSESSMWQAQSTVSRQTYLKSFIY